MLFANDRVWKIKIILKNSYYSAIIPINLYENNNFTENGELHFLRIFH